MFFGLKCCYWGFEVVFYWVLEFFFSFPGSLLKCLFVLIYYNRSPCLSSVLRCTLTT